MFSKQNMYVNIYSAYNNIFFKVLFVKYIKFVKF